MPQAFSAAHFFKRLGLSAYKAKSILGGATLTGLWAYNKYKIDKVYDDHKSVVEDICKSVSAEDQADFRSVLEKLIPAYEFEKLKISNPLESFFFKESNGIPSFDDSPAGCGKNSSKNLILFSIEALINYAPIDFSLRHETAHLLLGHVDEQEKTKKQIALENGAAAALLTAYRTKGISSASAAQVCKKNIGSFSLFVCYTLYNQYKLNQLIRKGEYEADAFALKHTGSVKELEKGIDLLNSISNEKIHRKMIEYMLKDKVLPEAEKEKKIDYYMAICNNDIYNAFFVTHPKTEERVAKIQEKIDLLKAQEAAADLEKEKKTNKS